MRRQDGPLRLGVLGCADIATRRVLPALGGVPDVELTAVASRSESKAAAAAAAFGGAAVTGYERLLDRDDVDAVYVPLPTGLHAEWIERALLSGRHVLAEKPLTTDHRHTAALMSLAGERGLVLMENFMFVHHAQHEHVRQLVASGAIGEPRAFTSTFTIPPRPSGDIRYQAGLGGGSLLDVGGYPVRAAQLFLGGELEVAGACLHYDDSLGVDVAGSALLQGGGGVTAQLTFGMVHLYDSSYQLHGSEGRVSVSRAFAPAAGHQPTVRLERPGQDEVIVLSPDDQYANAIRAFAAAVANGAPDGVLSAATTQQAKLVDAIRLRAGAKFRG